MKLCNTTKFSSFHNIYICINFSNRYRISFSEWTENTTYFFAYNREVTHEWILNITYKWIAIKKFSSNTQFNYQIERIDGNLIKLYIDSVEENEA